MQRTPPPSPPSGGASSSSPPSSTFSSFAQRILGFLAAGAGGLQSILKPPRQTFKILVSGLDAAGKTSILYKLKLGEIVSTIPTIGFNVESITHKTTTWISWDVGGCGKILPMIRHYAMGVDAVLFVIDSNDRARLPEALDELLILLKVVADNESDARLAATAADAKPPRRHRFLGTAVLANKQDLPGSLPFGAIAEAVGKSMSGMRDFDAPWAVFPSSIISGKGLWEALTWLQDQKAKRASADAAASGYLDGGSQSAGGPGLDRKQASANETPSASVVVDGLDPLPAPSYSTLPPREELMALVAASSDHGLSSTEFKERFERGDLEGFDHRAHLRAGYHILLRAMKEGKRDSEGTALFLHSLKRFIALAGSRVRNTFHVTMSIFWCTILQLAIQAERHNRFALSATDLDDDSFPEFLASQPHVMYSGLWRRHYSQPVLMSRDAASRFVVPDLRPFPAYIVLREASSRLLDDAVPVTASSPSSTSSHTWMAWVVKGVAMPIVRGRGSKELTISPSQSPTSSQSLSLFREKEIKSLNADAEILSLWEKGELNEADEETISRIIYCSVRQDILSGVSPAAAGKDLLPPLYGLTDSKGRRYSETEVHLRQRLFSAGLQAWRVNILQSFSSSAGSTIAASSTANLLPSFSLFSLVFPDTLSPDAWRAYYSDALWTSAAGHDGVAAPDLCDRLPDALALDPHADERLARFIQTATTAGAAAGTEEVVATSFEALRANVQAVLDDYSADAAAAVAAAAAADDDDDRFVAAVAAGALPGGWLHHGRLLRFVYVHLTRVRRRGEAERVATERIVDGLNGYFRATYLAHGALATAADAAAAAADPGAGAGPSPPSPPPPPALTPIVLHPGTTRVFFWIQMIAGRLAGVGRVAALTDFRAFLTDGGGDDVGGATVTASAGQNWDLADPWLWRRYYSDAVMESVEAMGLFVPPDGRRMPSFLV